MRKRRILAAISTAVLAMSMLFAAGTSAKAEEAAGRSSDGAIRFTVTNKVNKQLTDEDMEVFDRISTPDFYFGINVTNIDIVSPTSVLSVDWAGSEIKPEDIWGSEMHLFWLKRDENGVLQHDKGTKEKERNFTLKRAELGTDGNGDEIQAWDYDWGSDYDHYNLQGWDFFLGDTQYSLSEVNAIMSYKPDILLISALDKPRIHGDWEWNPLTYHVFVIDWGDKLQFKGETPAEDYVIDASIGDGVISGQTFAAVLQENQTRDVVIRSGNDVTFTFKAGTMTAVAGKTDYDFSVVVNRDYGAAAGLPSQVDNSNFVAKVDYNYSGQLPAEADIRIYVGTGYAGQTLYYSQLMNDGSLSLVQDTVVDAAGYITVKQNHCSSYVVMKTRPAVNGSGGTQTGGNSGNSGAQTGGNNGSGETQTGGSAKPQIKTNVSVPTGDSANIGLYGVLAALAFGVIVFVIKRKMAAR